MSAKEKLLNILEFMGEAEIMQLLEYVNASFVMKEKTWDDVEDDDPTPDEVSAFQEYRNSL